jgi:uncharacterized membrane protein YhhN
VSTVAFVVFAVAALVDWFAVGLDERRVEWVAKPVATLALVVVAASLDGPFGARQVWFAVALALSLAGDVFLMLPKDRFVPGLASFLLGHVTYVVGFWVEGDASAVGALAGAVGVGIVLAAVAPRIVTRVGGELRAPVVVYMGVIAAMFVSAAANGPTLAIVGAGAFVVSDSVLAWNKFVRPLAWAPVGIMVTYHVAQAALALSLA